MKLSEMISTIDPAPRECTALQRSVKETEGPCVALFDPVTRTMAFVPCNVGRKRPDDHMGGVRE